MNEFFFGVYPYICLTIFTLGLAARYVATPGEWNARSSNLFAQKSLLTGSYLFHYAIIFAFFGHVVGLLIPQSALSLVGFNYHVHVAVAGFFGKIFALCVLAGLGILLWRRLASKEVLAETVWMDIAVILLIMWQACTGGWQDFFGHFDAFDTVAPWIRGVLLWQPEPQLMRQVPLALKLHVVFGLAIFAIIPFSRLVHFFSVPLTWFSAPTVRYRRRYENL